MLMTEVQAAYLRVQLKRLPKFIEARKRNWEYMAKRFKTAMSVCAKSEPAYFGFTVVCPWRDKLVVHLEKNGVKTRPFFAGNITRHRPYERFKKSYPVADKLMEMGCFFGVWPGIGKKEREYIEKKILWIKK